MAGIKRPRARVPDLNFEIKRGGYQQSCGFEQCDAHAPTWGTEWHEVSRVSHVSTTGLPFAFVTYRRQP